MKDRLDSIDYFAHAPDTHMSVGHADEAVKALEALGYKPQEANKVVKALDDGQKTCEQLIREGLQSLAIR